MRADLDLIGIERIPDRQGDCQVQAFRRPAQLRYPSASAKSWLAVSQPFGLNLAALTLYLAFAPTLQAQWLPDADQKKNRDLWDQTGVELPTGLKFYDLPRVSQRLVTVNDTDCYGIYTDQYGGSGNVNQQLPWATPAGLHWSPKDQWRSAKAAYFPGRIRVVMTTIQVQNSFKEYQPQPGIRWTFPEGTVFAEMLVRRHRGHEWPFEIRRRSKRNGKWDGVTYRPFDREDQLPIGTQRKLFEVSAGKLSDFGLGPTDVTVHVLPKRTLMGPQWKDFATSKLFVTAGDDDSAMPRSYLGNVRSCAHCHSKAGESTSYGSTTIRGSDQALSWHPFTMETVNTDLPPRLDSRWPIGGN